MKITVVAMEIPYPPIHGGRVDIWRRIEALKHLGIAVQLICWVPGEPKPEDVAAMEQVVSDLQCLRYVGKTPLSRSRQLLELLRYPLGITSRRVYGSAWRNLLDQVQQFHPDVVMVDGIHASVLAQRLAQTLQIPFVLRSHNIEHQHRFALLKAAQGRQKLYSFLIWLHLKRLELSSFRDCLAFFDISVDDLEFWQAQGLKNGYFLPPLADFSQWPQLDTEVLKNELEPEPEVAPAYDVVFLGNLNRENNVAGIHWFLQEVVPRIQHQKPDVSILIAGSNPVQSIYDACEQVSGVDLKANPASALDTYASGRVLVNPIDVGGGVSIKSIDMLMLDRPIVSFPKGVYGLPESVKPLFSIAEDAQSFADEVLTCLSEGNRSQLSSLERYHVLNEAFGIPQIKIFVEHLNRLICQS